MNCEYSVQNLLSQMPSRIPIDGTFELTVRCNLHCKMCLFRHADCENALLRQNELTTRQWISLARQAAEAGTVSLLLTGGEPMLRSDFCELYEGIYKQGFLLTLYTNATLVTSEIMELLQKYPPNRIGVTIYGASPETYQKVCGDAGAFEKAMKGIQGLLTLPSIVDFRTTVIKDNYKDVQKMEQMVLEQFHSHCELIETRLVTSAVRGGCADVSDCRLSPKENIKLFLHRSEERTRRQVLDAGNVPTGFKVKIEPSKVKIPESSANQNITFFDCNAAMSSYTISWDGQLLGCQLLGQFAEDVKTQSFQKAWDLLPFRIHLPSLCEKCRTCAHFSICQACPATRYAESGDMGGYSSYFCEDTAELLKYT